jgi:hypothetical protein
MPRDRGGKPSWPEESADSTNFQYTAGSILPIYPTTMTPTAAHQPRAGVLCYSHGAALVRQVGG